MATTVQSASTRELLHELGQRIPEPQPVAVAVADFVSEHCHLSPDATMKFADFAERTKHVGLSKIKLSQSLQLIRGVSTYAGTANVRMVRGIRWK